MANFFAELKRRHVYRVAAAYVVVAWLILQVVNNIAPGLNLPNAAVTLVIMLLAVPHFRSLSSRLEFRSSCDRSARQCRSQSKNDPVDFASLSVLFAVMRYSSISSSSRRKNQHAKQPSCRYAVKPLFDCGTHRANLSSDPEQILFGQVTEEITAALARIPNPAHGRRHARHSSSKGEKQAARAIGLSLGAIYLIEGSVRKAGDRVRVTAQLVKADDGIGLWTNNYDRELKARLRHSGRYRASDRRGFAGPAGITTGRISSLQSH